MTKPKKPKEAPMEDEIRKTNSDSKKVLSDLVHEIGSMSPGDTDTKMIEVVGRAVDRAETREVTAKRNTEKRLKPKSEKDKNGVH